MKRLANLTLVLATAAACGCSNADTAPITSLVGTFVLVGYNGAALPTYIDPRLGACSSMIVGGSLATAEDGSVVFSQSYTTPCSKGSAVGTDTQSGRLSIAGTAITVAVDATALGPARVYTGALEGGQLTLHSTINSLVPPLEQTFVLARP